MRHLLIKLLLISVAIAQIPKEDFQDWNVIQDEDIWIGYSWGNYPWCKSNIILQNSADEILSIIEDVDNYKDIFDSVIYSKKHDDNLVHIALTMPFPFKQRDYVVKFEKKKIDKDIVYGFKSYSSEIKPVNDFIRLENAQGEWRLKLINDNLVKVSYIWNGELGGNFPNWGLSRAWSKQGNEVLSNLKEALSDRGDINEN